MESRQLVEARRLLKARRSLSRSFPSSLAGALGRRLSPVTNIKGVLCPVNPSFRDLSGRLKFTVRRHNFKKDSLYLKSLGLGVDGLGFGVWGFGWEGVQRSSLGAESGPVGKVRVNT